MNRPKTELEKKIQADIEADIGAERDLLLLRNSVGQARYVSDDNKVFYVPYGLGVGSPDLVGMLRMRGTVFVDGLTQPFSHACWFCLEVKQPGETAEPAQEKCHAVWRRFGAFIAVVTSVAEARAALERARRGDAA
ncbi:MAG: hypothetical protein JWM74_1092 [Myxococcaceae bacterium]|nr:hypothetical protein [Myxococcaceae bacterium]